MEYFVTRDGRQEGPLSLDEINQRLSEGTLSPSDLGWTESMGDWKPLQDIPGVIVQGRYDMICPPISAYRLAERWPGCDLRMLRLAGHALSEPAVSAELVRTMDSIAEEIA